jgi:lipopolysaccharide transport system ATP-binding protein
MRPIIEAEGVGKQYRIGRKREEFPTLRDALAGIVRAPRRRARGGSARARPETFWALRDVGFQVAPGEVVGIIGRNGAGKSTLLKILSRITEPTEGRVALYGRMASLLEVGTGFHPELTGRENIFLNGAILGMKRAELARKFDEIVAFAEIEKFIDTPVKHYSSGMYVRLAFAVAAHLEPEILVVDEVLAVGDVQFQKKCLGKMGEVARGGRTILFVSHNMGAVSQLCNKSMHIAAGRLKEFGPTKQVVANYMSEMFETGEEDLDSLRPFETDRSAEFVRLELRSEDGATLHFGEPVEFLLTLQSGPEMRDLSIGASIYNTNGNCVGSLTSRETFDVERGGLVTLLLKINANLAPGSYYAGFSIGRGGHTGPRTNSDIVIGKPAFQVLPITNDRDPVFYWLPSWGDIVFRDSHLSVRQELETGAINRP